SPGCTVHEPPPQVSRPLQKTPSLQGALLFGCWQSAEMPLQTSSVQPLPSVGHAVPFGDLASAGHDALRPVHVSCGSHTPADERQTTPEAVLALAGHVPLTPLQVSSGSQTPADERQMVPADEMTFAGQSGALPGHVSCGSHPPTDERHTNDDGRKLSFG